MTSDPNELKMRAIFRATKNVPLAISPQFTQDISKKIAAKKLRVVRPSVEDLEQTPSVWDQVSKWSFAQWMGATLALAGLIGVAPKIETFISNLLYGNSSSLTGYVGERTPIVAKVPSQFEKAAFVRVELPQGVKFFSETHPSVETNSAIVLKAAPDHTPIVLISMEEGDKSIMFGYLDTDRKLMGESKITIHFVHRGVETGSPSK